MKAVLDEVAALAVCETKKEGPFPHDTPLSPCSLPPER